MKPSSMASKKAAPSKANGATAKLITLIDSRIDLRLGAAPARAAGPSGSRFVKIGTNDQVLPESAARWDWVYDRNQQLLIAAEIIEGEFNYADAQKAVAKLHPEARSLEVQQLVSVLDYSRHGPAVDTTLFRWKPEFVWTATKAAWNASGYAWGVSLDYGYALYWGQSLHFCALACRPGQFLGL